MQFSTVTMNYKTLRSHSCRDEEVVAPHMDARAHIKEMVDGLALSDMTLSASAIWRRVEALFYAEANEYVVQGLSEQQVIKRVYRMRRKNFGGDVHGIVELPPLSLVKGTSLPFFQFLQVTPNDNPTKGPNRIIGWAHPTLSNLLRYPGVSLFIDGTFRCAPRGFAQCLVIMVYDCASGVYVPVYYILMTNRTTDSYFDAFHQVLLNTDQDLSPAEVICDFEAALVDAIGLHFPNAEVIGCLFHFKQAVHRRMKVLRIPKKEIKIAMGKRVLDMLTVMDPEKIESHGCHWVRKQIKLKCEEQGIPYSKPKWKSFWKYFDRTWLKKYDKELWNVNGLDNQLVARTNNPLERFNRELNAVFSTPHPSIPVFVAKICKVSQEYVTRLENIKRGRNVRKPREKISLPRAVNFTEPASESSESESDEDDVADDTDEASADEASESNSEESVDNSFDYQGSEASDSSDGEGSDNEDVQFI